MSFNYNPGNRYAYYARGLTPSNTDIYTLDMTYLFKDFDRPISSLKEGENPVEIGETEIVYNVFDDNASAIKSEAIPGIQYVVDYLEKFPDMMILVSAHSNKHDTRSESLMLSNQRAINILDYLVKNGINRNRLSYHGFGHDIVVNSKSNSKTPGINISAMVEFKLIGFNQPGN
jgi:hypothetical protein